jgi:hypothetical protein
LKLQRTVEVWGDSVQDAISKANWQGAADDVEHLREMLAGLEEGTDRYKIVKKGLVEAEKAYNKALMEQLGIGKNVAELADENSKSQQGIIAALQEQKKLIEEMKIIEWGPKPKRKKSLNDIYID